MGRNPLGGRSNAKAASAALSKGELCWPHKLQPYNLSPERTHEWESAFQEEIRTAIDVKISEGETSKLPEILAKEVTGIDVTVRGRKVRWMKDLDQDGLGEKPCSESKIHARMESELDALVPERVPVQLLHFCMAKIHSVQIAQGSKDVWESIYKQALVQLWDDTESWPALEQERGLAEKSKPIKESLRKLKRNWNPTDTKDRRHQSVRDRVRSEKLLIDMPKDSILWIVDKNDKGVLWLDPQGLMRAYNDDVVHRITEDVRTIFSLEPPRLPDAHRHPFHEDFLRRNPKFGKDQGFSGVSHIGHWHMTGYDNVGNILKSSDSFGHSSTCDQLLHQFMHHACGHVTRAVDLAFGVFDPEMRERYRKVFENGPQFARMSTTEREFACLRAFLSNLQTESHLEEKDWKGGYAWMTPFGNFTGGKLCIPQLGIQVDFPAGSISAIRGESYLHYITDWEGEDRFCFVHTTHESVRAEVEDGRKPSISQLLDDGAGDSDVGSNGKEMTFL